MINNSYDFITPGKVIFGWGRRSELPFLAHPLGERIHPICGSHTIQKIGILSEILSSLSREGFTVMEPIFQAEEPTVTHIDTITEILQKRNVTVGKDFLIAIGGGAAQDTAKAVAAMVTNLGIKHPSTHICATSVKNFLEGVGTGHTILHTPLPIIAIPTTAGAGAEATRNAVISSYDPPFKKSLRNDLLLPKIALVDPELTVSLPPAITAASGMDAITQLFESFISRRARPIPRAMALEGLRLAINSLETAVKDGQNQAAREKMAHAALLSGICLTNSGLGIAHGVAPALGTHCHVSHGTACALMLPVALRVNADVSHSALALLASFLFPNSFFTSDEDAIETLIYEINMLCNSVGTPRRLSEVGVTPEMLPKIVADSHGSSMSGNPRTLSDSELLSILSEIM